MANFLSPDPFPSILAQSPLSLPAFSVPEHLHLDTRSCSVADDEYSCYSWQRIENGFCESVHGYQVYNYATLERLMQIENG